MPIQATINGKRVELAQPMSLAQYLEDKGLSGRRIAAAHNGNVVSREEYDSVTIHGRGYVGNRASSWWRIVLNVKHPLLKLRRGCFTLGFGIRSLRRYKRYSTTQTAPVAVSPENSER